MPLDRYVRQMRYTNMGETGQLKLGASRALICGCGALGSVIANTLARAGVGRLRIVDRDFLELNNLQRQVLYDEPDVIAGLPKAVAAKAKLQQINSEIEVEAIVADLHAENIAGLLEGVDAILDGTDNFETRFLLNDASLRFNIPWVFGGCIGAEGQTMTIVPGMTPCFRCLIQEPPLPGSTPTCDTAGIVAPIVNVVASIQACEALKILSGNVAAVNRALTVLDLWDNRIRQVQLDSLRDSNSCPACQRREFSWLNRQRGSHSAVLCGRNAVQLTFSERSPIVLDQLAPRLAAAGRVEHNRYLLRFWIDDFVLTVFPDGRAIIGGTNDVAVARTLYAKYVGA